MTWQKCPCSKTLIALSIPLILCLATPAWSGTTTTVDLTSSGQPRQFIIYVPDSYDVGEPTPLLFMMHGLLSSAAQAAAPNGPYRWQSLADQEGFIVVFPDSYQDDSWDMNRADADFIRDIIGWAIDQYNIRTSHIFSTGHSMGGFFSYYVAVQLRNDLNKIVAFAEHSGGLIGGFWPTPVPTNVPSLKGLLLHSSGDTVVPYSLTTNLHQTLLARGHLSELITLPAGLDHNWERGTNATQWAFFVENASDDPVPSPELVPVLNPTGGILLTMTLLVSGIATGPGRSWLKERLSTTRKDRGEGS